MNKKIGIVVVCSLMLFLLFLLGIPGTPGENAMEQPSLGGPHSPLFASLELKPLPLVGKPAILTCTVTSLRDAPGTRIQIELPPDARLHSGSLTWQGDIPAGQPVTLAVAISFLKGGDEAIYCRAYSRVDSYNSWSDYVGYYVNIGRTKSMLGFAPVPAEKRNEVGKQLWKGNGQIISTEPPPLRSATEEVPPPPPNTHPLQQRESAPQTSTNLNLKGACATLTVTGRVGYADRSGNFAGANDMLVEVVNASTSSHLQWCWVDDDGYYSCPSIANPYPTGIRTVARSYTSFSPFSDKLVVVNPNVGTEGKWENAYTIWSGTSVFNTPSSCVGDMGVWWIDATGANRKAFWLESDLIRGWDYIWFETGYYESPQESIGSSTVEWNTSVNCVDSSSYYTRGGNICINSTHADIPDVVLHELGHNVMYTIYGNTMPTTYCPKPHFTNIESHVNCAWTEGWASFFAIAVKGDPIYGYPGGGSTDYEVDSSWGTTGWNNGDKVEGHVTGALWDILDIANEGTDIYLNGNIDDIWDTIFHQNTDTFAQYWAAWKSRGHQEPWVVMSIYQNTIDYRASKPTNFNKSSPSNGATGQAANPTLSWGASSSIYQYCIDTTNNKTCDVGPYGWISTGSNTSVTLSNLAPSTTYYWQVRSSGTLSHTYANAPDTWWSFTTTSAPGAFNKVSPSNGATGRTLSPTISWGASTGATSYEYCYDTSNDNACSSWTANGTSTSKVLSGLSANTTYYWHVRAKKSGFTTYANSSTGFWSFTTLPVPGAFNKSSPSNGATGQSLSPTISWGSSSNATSYEYCYDTSNDNACSSWISNGTSTSKALAGLSAGTTYYWHVRAKNSNGTTYSNGSSTAFWSFTTTPVPGAFNKTSPGNGATGQSAGPTLTWGSSSSATSYEYCYDTSNDNACSSWISNGTSTSKTLSGLSANTTYYWHVRAKNNNGTTYSNGSATAFWSFYTTSVSGAFNKTSPTSATIDLSLSPTLRWGSSTGATSYEYCYDTSNDNACSSWISNGTSTSKTLGGLSAGTTYYWHVRALKSGFITYSNASSTAFWSFTTAPAPGAFSKISPTNAGPTTLQWGSSSGATSYEYCYDTSNDNACSNWISQGYGTSILLDGLSPATTYYWHVRARNDNGLTYSNGSATAFWSFDTTSSAGSFNKSTPTTGTTGLSLSPTLQWASSSGATSYEYCYDTSNDNACSSWTGNGTSVSKALSGLSAGTTYYWHVRALKDGFITYSNGSSTAFWSFTTLPVPGAFNRSSPSNGATGQSLSPTISWGSSTGATSYEYCFDTSNDNACASWTGNGTSTSKALGGLSAGTTYYWHVRANNASGTTYSNASSTTFWSFTTAAAPGAFNKSSPANGALGQSLSPTISWGSSSNAASYEYCYDTSNDNACSSWTGNGTSTSMALGGLSAGTTYYWHVRALNSNGTTYSNASSTAFWSFTTAPLPGAFEKTSPVNGATEQSTHATLQWDPSSDATSYEYCYDTSDDNACSGWTGNGTSTSRTLSGLSISTTYYWHVRALTNSGTTYSNGSSTTFWSFTTTATPPPVGDDIHDPLIISILPSSLSLDTTLFTTEVDDPPFTACSCAPGYATVWYSFKPTTSGTLVVDTRGSSYDTLLGVWTGTRGSLTSLGCNNDADGTLQSRVVISLKAGTTYFIEVAEYGGKLSSLDESTPVGETLRGVGGNLVINVRWASLLTVRSVGTYDGWILESGEKTNVGGTLDRTSTTFILGDGAQNKQYRAILSFNTAGLPDNAVITKVTLKIRRQAVLGTNPFTILGGLKVDMRKPFFGTTPGLVISDFQAVAGKTAVAQFGATPVNSWYSAFLNATGRAYVNKTGVTQFRLRFGLDDNNDNGADYMRFCSGNYATLAARPTLVIEYYIP